MLQEKTKPAQLDGVERMLGLTWRKNCPSVAREHDDYGWVSERDHRAATVRLMPAANGSWSRIRKATDA